MKKLLRILQWVAVVYFGFMTIGCMLDKAAIPTLLLLLCTVFCVPKVQEIINQRVKIQLPVKIIATIVVFTVGISMLPKSNNNEGVKADTKLQTAAEEITTVENTFVTSEVESENVTEGLTEKSN